jgi:hypothetical protein
VEVALVLCTGPHPQCPLWQHTAHMLDAKARKEAHAKKMIAEHSGGGGGSGYVDPKKCVCGEPACTFARSPSSQSFVCVCVCLPRDRPPVTPVAARLTVPAAPPPRLPRGVICC